MKTYILILVLMITTLAGALTIPFSITIPMNKLAVCKLGFLAARPVPLVLEDPADQFSDLVPAMSENAWITKCIDDNAKQFVYTTVKTGWKKIDAERYKADANGMIE